MRPILIALAALSLTLVACWPDADEPEPTPEPTPTACGGWLGDTCGVNELCSFSLGATCGWADAPGTCEPIPQACTLQYMPVCGCDQQTYSNACVANSHGTSVYHAGPCECADGDLYEPSSFELNGTWTGTASWDIQLDLLAGSITKQDLISPCPEGVACIWSGIVSNKGSYDIAYGELEVSWTSPDNSYGVTTPHTLLARTDCDSEVGFVLVEQLSNGGTISYTKQ